MTAVHYALEDGLGNEQPVGPGHPLPVSGTFTGSSLSVGSTGAAVPTSADLIGWKDGSGNLQPSSAATPFPVAVISGGGSNASVGSNGAAIPTSSTLISWKDGSGNAQPVSAATPFPTSQASGSVASGAYASGAFAAGAGADGWNVTEGTKADAAWTSGSGSIVAILKAIDRDISGSIPAGTAVIGQTQPYTATVNGMTAAMTGTTSTQLLAAPGASLHNYITSIVISNTHASVDTEVTLQDGSGGTAFHTFPAPHAYGGVTISFNPPLRQPTANTALYCVNLTTGASTKVSVNGFTAA